MGVCIGGRRLVRNAVRGGALEVGVDRHAWVMDFSEALRELRPHLSLKLAATVALTEYRAGQNPKKAAAAYHRRHGTEPLAAPAKKRSG